ncbi:hypothetical protein EC957_004749 [Mortierella hygrophila]|uniref:Protein kinase domain-containing protein n=1 Tax=Mortierella hygrophila TaxID=979708 RepID=A0A9P6K6W7_9FUNG|nr:hypothetical protein EC957_004749 [Mortierella hygrophila]
MVERRGTGKVYALKYISKAQVIRMDAVRNILRERQILETLDHAFVVNMRFAFQDDEYMYMCMDLMMGGDLRFHLNRKQFGEDVVRFWIAELCSALTHLHSQAIVHRDIKPDNVLLDEKGHAHLTDFNIGCKLTAEKPFLTSQSGTVAYMAPEVFGRHGYATSVDWWAIGVLFYECIYNKRPFQTDTISDLKKAIPTQTIEFPEKEGLSKECISAMRGFLTRDPKERLGIKGGMEGIRQHPFFQAGAYQTNPDNWWYMLETKQLTPKFQPSSENVNFDATYDLEELLLDDEPLTYRSTRKRAQRMQKEKDKAIKEENARIKAEQQQEALAAAAAELTMSSLALDDYYVVQNNIKESGTFPQKQEKHSSKKLAKKRSKVYLGGGTSVGNKVDSESSSGNNNSSSQIHLSQQPAMPQQYNNHHGQYAQGEHMNGSGGHGTMPTPANAPLQFPALPPPSASAQSARNMHHPQLYQSGGYSRQHAGTSLPPPPSQDLPLNPTQLSQATNGNKHSLDSSSSHKGGHSITTAGGGVQSGSTSTGYSYSTSGTPGQGVTAIYLSKPAIPSSNGTYVSSSYKGSSGGPVPVKNAGRKAAYCVEDDMMGKSYPGSASQLIQQQYQQRQQQQQFASTSTSSSSSIGAPSSLPHPLPSRSQHKHIPPQHQHYQHHQQQYNQQQVPMQRQVSPLLVAATEVAAAKAAPIGSDPKDATASANMSKKEKISYQMAMIDREFLTFDYTVYESYHGLVDPLTMSVGDPPEWVRSRDH